MRTGRLRKTIVRRQSNITEVRFRWLKSIGNLSLTSLQRTEQSGLMQMQYVMQKKKDFRHLTIKIASKMGINTEVEIG